jgi:hypothetical protein
MFSVKFPTEAIHEYVPGFSVLSEAEFILELNLSLLDLDPFERHDDEKKLSLALNISNHLKYVYKNTMDSMALVNAIDALDIFLDECVEKKKSGLTPSSNNGDFDGSLPNGDYAVEIRNSTGNYVTLATFHQEPVFLDYSWLGRHLASTPFHWTGKSGFSTIYFDDSEIIRVIEKEPSLEGIPGNGQPSLVGYQLERILSGKATLSSGTYKELPLKRDAGL